MNSVPVYTYLNHLIKKINLLIESDKLNIKEERKFFT